MRKVGPMAGSTTATNTTAVNTTAVNTTAVDTTAADTPTVPGKSATSSSTPAEPTKIAVVVLNYRTPQLTLDCLATLQPELDGETVVVVVDNASGDGSAERLAHEIEDRGWSSFTTLLRAPHNGGFAAGNNLGILSVEADAYLLLNSDTLVCPGALRSLRDAMATHRDAGVIGAGLLTAGGDIDASRFRNVGPFSEFLRAADTGVLSRLLDRFDPTLPPTHESTEVDWVGFAAVIIRREVIAEVGLLDDGFFMYFEDVDYCRRAAAAGWRVRYWPHARFVHLQGASSQISGHRGRRRRAPRTYYAARARYFARYYGRAGLWLANGLWCLGRVVSYTREVLGRPSSIRPYESRDIWTGVLAPLGSEHGRIG
jgi:N-acetylglucosaminyl-diphospho-decaprenol L-rhamnosyltransferase